VSEKSLSFPCTMLSPIKTSNLSQFLSFSYPQLVVVTCDRLFDVTVALRVTIYIRACYVLRCFRVSLGKFYIERCLSSIMSLCHEIMLLFYCCAQIIPSTKSLLSQTRGKGSFRGRGLSKPLF
jgi:hypothetical protein